ncbi:MAG: hypothetical protein PF508_17110 [Spirochaeta sp.]|jgi:hypothetical protein|nr:hypothetical protein [Spirochaeta sp.]
MMVTLYRKDDDGSTRYVTITDRQGNLFGYPTLTVTAGRDFFLTSERHFTYESAGELQKALRGMIDRRLKNGFEVLYSYFRHQQFRGLQQKLGTTTGTDVDTVAHSGAEPRR